MSLLSIIQYPHGLLKQRSEEVPVVTVQVRTFVKDMFETMYGASGVGLAAVQVARPERILVVDVGKMKGDAHEPHPLCIVNPEIVSSEGKIVFEEGCLSCPQLRIPIERAAQVVVKGVDEYGKPLVIEAGELLAIALQHEMDHLNGKLLVDRLSRLKRAQYKEEIADTGSEERVDVTKALKKGQSRL